jgi:hypothetical protein
MSERATARNVEHARTAVQIAADAYNRSGHPRDALRLGQAEQHLRRAEQVAAFTDAATNVEQAARELDALFDGEVSHWTLDGKKVTEDAAAALLSLHDYLNDLQNAREALNAA